MRSNIALAFQNCKKEKRPALITYTVAGDNSKNNSLKILNEISNHSSLIFLFFITSQNHEIKNKKLLI